jgi:hypothetical protein
MTYVQNHVFEQVEVIAHFHNLKVDILKFKWNNQVYRVDQITSTWKVPNGDGFYTHFLAICKEKEIICELSLNHTDMKWELIQYDTLM